MVYELDNPPDIGAVHTLPFIIFTMGIGMLFINALIIYWAARLIPGDGILVSSYWGGALGFVYSIDALLGTQRSTVKIERRRRNRHMTHYLKRHCLR